MTCFAVVWNRHARDDLLALYDWIAERSDRETAFEYTSGIEAHARLLADFPHRGVSRDDIVPGLRTIPYRGRTVIAYRVVERTVHVLRLRHAGQDWPTDAI